jgi:hypothetical protein
VKLLQFVQWHNTAPLSWPVTVKWIPLQRHDPLMVVSPIFVFVGGLWFVGGKGR